MLRFKGRIGRFDHAIKLLQLIYPHPIRHDARRLLPLVIICCLSTTLTGHRSHRHIPCHTRMDWFKRIPNENTQRIILSAQTSHFHYLNTL